MCAGRSVTLLVIGFVVFCAPTILSTAFDIPPIQVFSRITTWFGVRPPVPFVLSACWAALFCCVFAFCWRILFATLAAFAVAWFLRQVTVRVFVCTGVPFLTVQTQPVESDNCLAIAQESLPVARWYCCTWSLKAAASRSSFFLFSWLTKKEDEREAAAFKLQVQQYQRATGKDSWAIAKQLSDSTGWVWTVKNGTPVQTNTRTVTWRKNQATANAAKVANRIRQQNANTQQNKAAQQADKTKGTGGLTPNQVVIRENTWMGGMSKAVDKIVGAQKTTNPITNKVTLRPAHMPPKKADLVRKIYNSVGPSLVGRIPRWTPAYLKSLIYAYISTLPNAWWDPKTYKVKK